MDKDILIQIALQLPLKDIYHLCQSNIGYNELLCNNQDFWKLKYYQDFSEYIDMTYIGIYMNKPIDWDKVFKKSNQDVVNNMDWKQLYINFGKTYGVGMGYFGQLGSSNKYCDTLTEMMVSEKQHAWYNIFSTNSKFPLRSKQLACGKIHTLAIDTDDYLWVFGNNTYNQLGLPASLSEKPTKFNLKAKAIACGEYHNLFIGMNDNLYTFGYNKDGQLGNDHKTTDKIYNLHYKVKKIACGYNHSLFIDRHDEVWVMGNNVEGQLGLGDRVNRYEPTKLGMKAKDIAGGIYHSILIDMDDCVWTFGNNEIGQLGLGDNLSRLIPTKINDKPMSIVKCGRAYTMMIDINGNLLGCGNNSNGELGSVNQLEDRPIWLSSQVRDIFCGAYHSLYITTAYQAYGLGSNLDNRLLPNTDLRVKTAACGEFITLISTF